MTDSSRAVYGLLIFAAFVSSVIADDHLDVVDTSIRHQVIDNFGASDAWTMKGVGTWSDENKNKIADLLFSTDRGIGLSLWRFNIGGGINRVSINNPDRSPETFEIAPGKYDWTRQAPERWFAHAARERGVPFLLGFVNSPPGTLTRNGLTNSGDDEQSTTNLKPGCEEQYAKYLCDIVQHFRDEPDPKLKLIFNYLSPVNEPQIDWARGSQEGSRCSNDDIKKILVALRRELDARHLDTRIRALESSLVPDLWRLNAKASKKWNAPYGNYLQAFLGDPAIAPLMDHTLCYHDYSSFDGPEVEKDHRKLGEVFTQYPDSKLWMSEICILSAKRDLGMTMALQVARLIHADLALSGASAWQWWLAVSNGDYKDGLLYTDWRRPGDPESIIISKTFWALGNFSRFIRPGMQRIELQGDAHAFDGLLGSAYIDPASGRLVLVYVNSGDQPQRVTWTFKGSAHAPKTFTPYVTSDTENLRDEPRQSSGSAVEIPAKSIVTFVENVL
jgi:O-glycosyl hydrolase